MVFEEELRMNTQDTDFGPATSKTGFPEQNHPVEGFGSLDYLGQMTAAQFPVGSFLPQRGYYDQHGCFIVDTSAPVAFAPSFGVPDCFPEPYNPQWDPSQDFYECYHAEMYPPGPAYMSPYMAPYGGMPADEVGNYFQPPSSHDFMPMRPYYAAPPHRSLYQYPSANEASIIGRRPHGRRGGRGSSRDVLVAVGPRARIQQQQNFPSEFIDAPENPEYISPPRHDEGAGRRTSRDEASGAPTPHGEQPGKVDLDPKFLHERLFVFSGDRMEEEGFYSRTHRPAPKQISRLGAADDASPPHPASDSDFPPLLPTPTHTI